MLRLEIEYEKTQKRYRLINCPGKLDESGVEVSDNFPHGFLLVERFLDDVPCPHLNEALRYKYARQTIDKLRKKCPDVAVLLEDILKREKLL